MSSGQKKGNILVGSDIMMMCYDSATISYSKVCVVLS